MRINKITIQNYKCFENQTFEFTKPFTVITGFNGKGKTSILDALALSMSAYTAGIDGISQRQLRKDEIRLNNENEYQLPVSITVEGDIKSITMVWEINVTTQTGTIKKQKSSELIKIATEDTQKVRQNAPVLLPVLIQFNKFNDFSKNSFDKKRIDYQKAGSRLDAYQNSLQGKLNQDFLSWYKTYEDEAQKFQHPKDIEKLDAFNTAVLSVLKDYDWKTMNFSNRDNDLKGTLNSGLQINYSTQISAGHRVLINLIADIAYHCIILNPQLGINTCTESEGIVLIDEIQNSIDKPTQQKLLGYLHIVFPKIQFIIATHSEYIVNDSNKDFVQKIEI